jgi:hypothetical protein
MLYSTHQNLTAKIQKKSIHKTYIKKIPDIYLMGKKTVAPAKLALREKIFGHSMGYARTHPLQRKIAKKFMASTSSVGEKKAITLLAQKKYSVSLCAMLACTRNHAHNDKC